MVNIFDFLSEALSSNSAIAKRLGDNFTAISYRNGNWTPVAVPFCLRVQTYSIKNVIIVWDLVLLIPNIFFVLFLLIKWFRVRVKLRTIRFPILTVFYNLILLISLLSIMRCVVTILIKPVNQTAETINKIVWLIVRFSQLSTELSVVLFGLFFARLDSHKSILRIMYLTIPISLVYVLIQGALEMIWPDTHYIVIDNQSRYFDLYGHGGMIFWFISSAVFAIIYTVIFFLPFTKFRQIFPIPTKRSFYAYCLILAIICLAQSIGSLFVYTNIDNNGYGLCLLDLTTFLYFTLFGPLVYIVFLRKFFQKEAIFPSSYTIKDADTSFSNSASYQPQGSAVATAKPQSPLRGAINTNYEDIDDYNEVADDNMVTIMDGTSSLMQKKSRSTILTADAWATASSPPFQAQQQPQHDSFDSSSGAAAASRTNRAFDYTTSVLLSARESLNRHLRQTNIQDDENAAVNDDFYLDDDDTKVIIIKRPI